MNLKKELNLLDVFCISTGAMLSGLFILPGLAFELGGAAILISYLLAGLLALSGLLSQAELASAMPKAGGTYFYVTRSMGAATGTVYGLITWLSLVLKSAYELVFLAVLAGIAIKTIGPEVNIHVLAVLFCAAFLALNAIGAKEAGRVQVYLVAGLLVILLYFCGRGVGHLEAHNFVPFMDKGWNSIITVAGFVFISYGGLLKVASIAEEVKNPGKVLPLGMIFSLLVICLIYMLTIFVAIGVMGENLAGSKSPLSDTAVAFSSNFTKNLMILAAMLAIVTAANSGIMAASRYPLALARDEMLPKPFATINTRFKTPHISILLTGIIIMVAIFIDVKVLVKAASSVLILTYMFTCFAVVILRESRIQNYRPEFKTPLYPWVQLVGIIGLSVLMFKIGLEAFISSCVLAVLGFIVYWFYGRKRADQEYALLHLIERITDRELTTHALESELKEIIHERDEVLKDRFDHLIESCPVLDIEEGISLENFFRKSAEAIAKDIQVSADELYNLFLEREKESSTVLNQFLAIPHIVIPGENRFDILLARCKEGIAFSQKYPKVHTVFFLIGSRDERPFHLQSLAAICQIIQHDDFEEQWMKAKKTEALRDIVLLGKRKRSVE
ncbi:MAG: amino acid permease [Phycisphaerae bacterium]|nr:amino acid permease [Phycisphaerae bacterium]